MLVPNINLSVELFRGEGEGAWIGLNDINTEGAFQWNNGAHVTYTKWASNQPNNENDYQNCVCMRDGDGRWDDVICGKYLPFICEKKASSTDKMLSL